MSETFWNYLIPGITLGFAAAVQPGPLSIYLITRTLQSGWKKTFPAVFVPVITDGPVAVLCLLILGNLPGSFLNYLRIGGGLFILYLAFGAARSWKNEKTAEVIQESSSKKTLIDAMIINILNPNAYIAWSLVMGPLLLAGWRLSPATGISLLTGFYLTMFITTIIILIFFDQARDRVPKLQRILIGISAIFLASLGVFQIYTGIVG